uniref:Chromo domain-containing protein n=1 Tax=Caenorhabditis tropicalis TaxID=1561998 RepID=A0A1I7UZ91_9PELO
MSGPPEPKKPLLEEGNHLLKKIIDVRFNEKRVEFHAIWQENDSEQWVPMDFLGGGRRNYFVKKLLEDQEMKQKYDEAAKQAKAAAKKSKRASRPRKRGSEEPRSSLVHKLCAADLVKRVHDVRLGKEYIEFYLCWRLDDKYEWVPLKHVPAKLQNCYLQDFLEIEWNRQKYNKAVADLNERIAEKERAKEAALKIEPTPFSLKELQKHIRAYKLEKKKKQKPRKPRRGAHFTHFSPPPPPREPKKAKKPVVKTRDSAGHSTTKAGLYNDLWKKKGWELCNGTEEESEMIDVVEGAEPPQLIPPPGIPVIPEEEDDKMSAMANTETDASEDEGPAYRSLTVSPTEDPQAMEVDQV